MSKQRNRLLNQQYSGTGFQGYPIGTVAYYGPDDKTVTKAAVGIVKGENQECSDIQRWAGTDIVKNSKVQKEILDFLKCHQVKSTVITEGPIGCIHEEGQDYPVGEDCPFCPFWQGKQ